MSHKRNTFALFDCTARGVATRQVGAILSGYRPVSILKKARAGRTDHLP
ncbi:manganese/iron transporter, NRAMP family domain protein [Burkholderia pseudomallei MSHR456]|nr:manganese/iron transporter, NRAMP family domain protein [Burkholderia pseudomallei MSHR456]